MTPFKGVQDQAFRDKEGFLILFDMASDFEISQLPQWMSAINQKSTNPHSIVLILGYNDNG